MCGIVAVIKSGESEPTLRARVLESARCVRHRGPDWSGLRVQCGDGDRGHRATTILAHERLGIVSPEDGAQPLLDETGAIALTVNGEIYNHATLHRGLRDHHVFATGSDCEVIVHLWEEVGPELVDRLDGVFAFVLSDGRDGRVLAARDAIGVKMVMSGEGSDEIFDRHFPGNEAAWTVAAEPSIACSSATALRWESEWEGHADPSGRSITSHVKAW
jgi:asparagine synthase (glutamine-hydrolysing)